MGNSQSSSNFIPNSLLECFNRNGEFDIELYALYRRRRRQLDDVDALLTEAFDTAMEEIASEKADNDTEPRARSVKKRKLECVDPHTNEIREQVPKLSSWYVMYIHSPQLSSMKWRQKFRRVSFIIPHVLVSLLITILHKITLLTALSSSI